MSTILCFSNIDWGFLRYRKQHLMERLSARHQVVYVNPPRAMKARAPRTWDRLERVEGRLLVYHPPVLPLTRSLPLSRAAGRRWIVWRLRRVLRDVGRAPLIVWACTPHALGFLGRFGERLAVYDMADDYTSPIDLEPDGEREVREIARLDRLEREMCRRADLVLAVSAALASKKAARAKKIEVVPNGCDASAFAGPVSEPADLRPLPRPRIGFAGAIWPRVDLDLLRDVATAYPSASLVLIGPVLPSVPIERVLRLPNVRWLGPKPHAELPAYLAHLDVGLLPYKPTELTRCSSPLKLWEYLAAGCGVVSVRIPQVEEMAAAHVQAVPRRDFVEAVGKALATGASVHRDARTAFARQHDWADRVNRIELLIEEALSGRTAPRTCIGDGAPPMRFAVGQ